MADFFHNASFANQRTWHVNGRAKPTAISSQADIGQFTESGFAGYREGLRTQAAVTSCTCPKAAG
jgi:hypothetical protein